MYEENNVIQDVSGVSKFFTSVFSWMFIGLLVTALTAYLLVSTGFAIPFLINPILIGVFFIAEFILVFFISKSLYSDALTAKKAKILFVVYSIINGITLSSIFYVYEIGLIYKAFLYTALMFGVMSIYGHYTKADLSKFGSILIMGLVGVIIVTLLNYIFSFFGMYSGPLDVILAYITLFIFLGLTAFDVQKLKAICNTNVESEDRTQAVAIYGALSLYLDFINIFLSLLRISSSRD